METFTNCTDLSLNCCESDTVSDFLSNHDHQEKYSLETLSLSGDSNPRSVDDALFLFDDAFKDFDSEIDSLSTDFLNLDNIEFENGHLNNNLEVAVGSWPNNEKCVKDNWQTAFGMLCSKCDQIFTSKLYFDKHFVTDHSGSDLIYTCSCCLKQFQSYSNFRNHCYRHYKSQTPKLEKIPKKTVSQENIWISDYGIMCTLCNKIFYEKYTFDKHFQELHQNNDPSYTCSHCHKQCQSYSSFRKHCYRHYKSQMSKLSKSLSFNEQKENDGLEKIPKKTVSQENIWISIYGIMCTLCNEKFFKKITFDEHFEKLHPNNDLSYTCSSCNQVHQDYSKFRNHCYRHITSEKYKCKFCSKSYSHQSALLNHIDVKHLDKKKFSCNSCEKKFFTLKGLQLHITKIHSCNVPQFECPHCNKVLQTRSGYDAHVKEFHTKATQFNCSICNLQFTQKVNLKEHMTRHENEPIHGCSHCSAIFRNQNDLKRHLRTVHPEKGYECKVCNKIFKTQSHIREHMQSHTMVKAHTCSVCAKGFSSNYKLEQHFNTHVGLKPHKCQHCDMSYANYSNLLKHLRCKHNTNITNTNYENNNTLKLAVSTMPVINPTENVEQSVITDNGNNLRNELIINDKPDKENYSDQSFEEETILISYMENHPDNITVLSTTQKENNFNSLTDNCFVMPQNSNSLHHHENDNILCVLLLPDNETSGKNEDITMSSFTPEIENQVSNTCNHNIISDDSHSKVLPANYNCDTRETCYDDKTYSLITNNNDISIMDCNPSTSILIQETNKYVETNDLDLTDTHSNDNDALNLDKEPSSNDDQFDKNEWSLGDELVASMSLEDLDFILNETDTEFDFDNFAELNNSFTFGDIGDDGNIIVGF